MDIKSITHEFVAICDQKTRKRVDLGLVVGFVLGQPYGIQAKVFSISCQKMKVVSLEDCMFVPKADIITPATLLRLQAQHEQFGKGVIMEARRPKMTMEVRLQNRTGLTSDWYSLEVVTVLGPRL